MDSILGIVLYFSIEKHCAKYILPLFHNSSRKFGCMKTYFVNIHPNLLQELWSGGSSYKIIMFWTWSLRPLSFSFRNDAFELWFTSQFMLYPIVSMVFHLLSQFTHLDSFYVQLREEPAFGRSRTTRPGCIWYQLLDGNLKMLESNGRTRLPKIGWYRLLGPHLPRCKPPYIATICAFLSARKLCVVAERCFLPVEVNHETALCVVTEMVLSSLLCSFCLLVLYACTESSL
jgi:hypothetical protein